MRVALEDIAEDGLVLTGTLPPQWVAELADDLQVERETMAAAVDLRLRRHGARVMVRGDVSVDMATLCSRCLQPVALSLELPIEVDAVAAPQRPEPEENGELTEEAVGLETYDDDGLDLGRILHDEVVLELPTQTVCQDSCQGLCSRCGVNRNETSCACEQQAPQGPFAVLSRLQRSAQGNQKG